MKARGIYSVTQRRLIACGVVVAALCWMSGSAESAEEATVRRDRVHVYAQMATTSQVVTVLNRGAKVNVDFVLTGPDGAWCHVTIDGRTGYLRCKDLDREAAPRWRETLTQPEPPARQQG